MATFTVQFLSGSTDGLGIPVVATTSPGTLIHTAHATAKDEIYIDATNTDTVSRWLKIEWGDVGALNEITLTVPAQSGLTYIVPGDPLTNSREVRAYAQVASKIVIRGEVQRIL